MTNQTGKKSFHQFHKELSENIFEQNLRYALSEEFSEEDLRNEIQLNEGIASSAAAVGLYFRNARKLKSMDFSKPENIGKGFGIIAQLIALSHLAGTSALKKVSSKMGKM